MGRQNKSQAKKFLPEKSSTSSINPKFISILKLAIFISILPVALGYSYGFLCTFYQLDKAWVNLFWAGVASFFVIDLIIYKLAFIYKKGQRIIEVIFHFFAPLFRFAPYVLPVYTILILVFSVIIAFLGKVSSFQAMFMFLTGFSIILHLSYTADSLRVKEADFLKAGYFFAILLIYLFNLIILGFTIARILPEFSFLQFIQNSSSSTRDVYTAIFNQLFSAGVR